MPEEPITLRQFHRMEPGMTYDEVVRLVGREGQLRWRADGVDGPVVAKYFWSNADESYAEAAFENSRLAYKNQFGLDAGGVRGTTGRMEPWAESPSFRRGSGFPEVAGQRNGSGRYPAGRRRRPLVGRSA